MRCTPWMYKQAMRLFPAAVNIISTGSPGYRVGMTATAVCSLTAEPPQIMVCLNRQAGTARAVRENGYFAVNVLGNNHTRLAQRFASIGCAIFGDEKFDPAIWDVGQTGVPVLRDSVLVIECQLVAAYEVDTHVVAIGAGYDVWSEPDRMALIYRDGGFGTWAPIHQ